MDTLYTFWDNITHYKTESVHFWGLMNSATKYWNSSSPTVDDINYISCITHNMEYTIIPIV